MATEPACLLIADISGYTEYLSGVELTHAEDILADLMDTIVDSLGPGFRLAKLEGDAAFTYAVTEKIDGSLLLDTIERCYFEFRRRRRDVRHATSCACNACVRIPDLNLKFVVHHGTILRQRVAGRDELLGPDVIVVHRLLKNDVVELTGIEAYALFTQSCVDAMDVDVSALGMLSTSQTYEHIGTLSAWVHDLERRWHEEESRTRVIVTEAEATFRFEQMTSAPPQVLWEFATAPGRRVGWQAGVTGVKVLATGNRRGVGSTNHCLHGKGASVEHLLDWRPYDYLTIRNTVPTPMGKLHFLQTTELMPQDGGTVLHLRMGPAETRRERIVARLMAPMLERALRASGERLSAQLDAELERRSSDADGEPILPTHTDRPVGGRTSET